MPGCLKPGKASGLCRSHHRQALRGGSLAHKKLTPAAVRAIRALYRGGGHSMRSLGEQFGVSQVTVLKIIRRRTWKDID